MDEDGEPIELTRRRRRSDRSTRSTKTLGESGRYRLHLVDADGRTNKEPPEFVFNVTPNRPPDVKIAVPARDVRVSPIEELQTKASVWDDFGLRAYGVSFSLAGQPAEDVVLGRVDHAQRAARSRPSDRLRGARGRARPAAVLLLLGRRRGAGRPAATHLGDMYFAEVRHFEEIFRQGEQPPGGRSSSNSSNSRAARTPSRPKSWPSCRSRSSTPPGR